MFMNLLSDIYTFILESKVLAFVMSYVSLKYRWVKTPKKEWVGNHSLVLQMSGQVKLQKNALNFP